MAARTGDFQNQAVLEYLLVMATTRKAALSYL